MWRFKTATSRHSPSIGSIGFDPKLDVFVHCVFAHCRSESAIASQRQPLYADMGRMLNVRKLQNTFSFLQAFKPCIRTTHTRLSTSGPKHQRCPQSMQQQQSPYPSQGQQSMPHQFPSQGQQPLPYQFRSPVQQSMPFQFRSQPQFASYPPPTQSHSAQPQPPQIKVPQLPQFASYPPPMQSYSAQPTHYAQPPQTKAPPQPSKWPNGDETGMLAIVLQ